MDRLEIAFVSEGSDQDQVFILLSFPWETGKIAAGTDLGNLLCKSLGKELCGFLTARFQENVCAWNNLDCVAQAFVHKILGERMDAKYEQCYETMPEARTLHHTFDTSTVGLTVKNTFSLVCVGSLQFAACTNTITKYSFEVQFARNQK